LRTNFAIGSSKQTTSILRYRNYIPLLRLFSTYEILSPPKKKYDEQKCSFQPQIMKDDSNILNI